MSDLTLEEDLRKSLEIALRKRTAERLLRDVGWSKEQAKADAAQLSAWGGLPPAIAEVEKIRSGGALTDIPSMLRDMADMIEEGRYGEVRELLLVRSVPGEPPAVHGYGQITPDGSLRLLACAHAELVRLLNNGPVGRA